MRESICSVKHVPGHLPDSFEITFRRRSRAPRYTLERWPPAPPSRLRRSRRAELRRTRTAGAPPRGDERFGPLAILRTRKADGRALLLFSRVERDATDEPA